LFVVTITMATILSTQSFSLELKKGKKTLEARVMKEKGCSVPVLIEKVAIVKF
jgi:hypothetical protein